MPADPTANLGNQRMETLPDHIGHVAPSFEKKKRFNTLALRPTYRISLRLGDLEPGEQATVSFEGTVTAGPVLSNQATVTSGSRTWLSDGDPVVPLTSYQPGTELATIADMSDLIFKGTVDEIDVGKLEPGGPDPVSQVAAIHPHVIALTEMEDPAPPALDKEAAREIWKKSLGMTHQPDITLKR